MISVGLDVVNHQRSTSFLSNDNNYIGAISVDGVRVKNQNLTARLPSTTGLPDFWRFVAEQNIELIVILQCPEPDDPVSIIQTWIADKSQEKIQRTLFSTDVLWHYARWFYPRPCTLHTNCDRDQVQRRGNLHCGQTHSHRSIRGMWNLTVINIELV